MKILLLNGVNLNMLGRRNPQFYGTLTLSELESEVARYAKERYGVEVVAKQSNAEGELVDILQQTDCDAVIFNAGAYSHYSYALRDCIECIPQTVVDVHLSDIYSRESFRRVDVLKEVCEEQYVGNGLQSYFSAVDYIVKSK